MAIDRTTPEYFDGCLADIYEALSHLTTKMNRVEATVAQMKPAEPAKITIDIDTTAVSQSIAQIEAALRDIESRKLVTIGCRIVDEH